MRFPLKSPGILTIAVVTCLKIPIAPAQFGSNPFANGPSFGLMNKKSVSLRSKLPPIYNASGKTIGISASDSLLTTAIEKQLTQSDSSIHVSSNNPDLLIEGAISQSSPVHTVRTTDSTGSAERWQGDLSVTFRISEPRTRRVVKSDIAEAKVDQVNSTTTNPTAAGKVFGLKTPASGPVTTAHKGEFSTTAEAQNSMINEVARRIASYLVNTEQIVNVPLAVGGPLNGPNKLVDSGLWPRYLEALEVLTPSNDPKADAYRLYDIGVANEALAYQAQDNKSAIKYLEQASNDYGKAFDAKPQEKGFIEAQTRIKSALQYYSDIGKTTPLGSASPLAGSINVNASSAGALTNKDVVDMVSAHMDDANLLDNIQNAPDVNFDLSIQGQIALQKAGVNSRILLAMKERVRGTSPQPKRH
jgi:hypothetical protein